MFQFQNFETSVEKNPKKNKVLVVEDEPFWQIVVERAFKQTHPHQFEIGFASSFNDAMDYLHKNRDIDFILADHYLDGAWTGLDLWDELNDQRSEIPYVLMSATKKDDFMNNLMNFRTEAVPRFLEKPTSIKELPKRLTELLTTYGLVGSKKDPKTTAPNLSAQMKRKYGWLICLIAISFGVALQFSLYPVKTLSLHSTPNQSPAQLFTPSSTKVSDIFTPEVIESMQALAADKNILLIALN